jgi:hypothetical protein
LDWACRNCPRKRYADLHDYTKKLFRLHRLQKAGYPLAANDLTIDEWMDLGRIADKLSGGNRCPVLPLLTGTQ